MNWGAWEELDEIGDLESVVGVEYSDVPLLEQVENDLDSYRKPISIIYPPEGYVFKNMYLGKYGMLLYKEMKVTWGLGSPTPFDDIAKLAKDKFRLNRRATAVLCCKMWGRGLVRKWGEGIYREGYLKRSMNKVGKFYGVRYEVLK